MEENENYIPWKLYAQLSKLFSFAQINLIILYLA